jgi:membrane protein implicated in regulation of membrane protease activity
MELLLAPAAKPFTIAALILFGLVVAEIGTMVVGNPMSQWFDHSGHPEGDGHGSLFGALDWLNAGRVPLIGFAVVGVARMLLLPLPAIVTSGIALVLTVPVLRTSSRALARIMPRDETYAVEEEDLVGRTAQVTVGPLDDGLPGRVKLRDSHGNWHFPRARAAKGHGPMAVGSTVLLVDREGSAFLAIPVPDELVKS